MMSTESFMPTDRTAITGLAQSRREHRDHPAALRLFGRMKRRPVLLLNPVPQGIKRLITEWLHREQLALGVMLYVDVSGRRITCVAHACSAWRWHHWPLSVLLPPLPDQPPRRVIQHVVFWPSSATGTRFPDLPL